MDLFITPVVLSLFLLPIDSLCCHRTALRRCHDAAAAAARIYEWIMLSWPCYVSMVPFLGGISNFGLKMEPPSCDPMASSKVFQQLTPTCLSQTWMTYSDLQRPQVSGQAKSFSFLVCWWLEFSVSVCKTSACVKTSTHIEIHFICWHLNLSVCVYPHQLGPAVAI